MRGKAARERRFTPNHILRLERKNMAELFDGIPGGDFKVIGDPVALDSHMKRGDWAELTALLRLMEEGYEVFKNIRNTGPVDIVGFKDGKVRLFDVKYSMVELNGKRVEAQCSRKKLRENQTRRGIEILYVSQHGLCAFSQRALTEKYKLLTGAGNIHSGRYMAPKARAAR